MSELLKKHIQKFTEISDEEFAEILTFFHSIKPNKKENLLTEGQICKSNFFVVKGCLRLFFINDKGVEQTIQFAMENWWLADYSSFENQKASTFYIQAVEKSEILAIDYSSQEDMLNQFPKMERYYRLIHQRAHAASQFRIRWLYTLSKEEQYNSFVQRYPEFVKRIPQYLLASFLGLTPEYLSEIRGKKLS